MPILLKASGIPSAIDALGCQQLGNDSRISTTPSRLICPTAKDMIRDALNNFRLFDLSKQALHEYPS
jgi:hypothetical protein